MSTWLGKGPCSRSPPRKFIINNIKAVVVCQFYYCCMTPQKSHAQFQCHVKTKMAANMHLLMSLILPVSRLPFKMWKNKGNRIYMLVGCVKASVFFTKDNQTLNQGIKWQVLLELGENGTLSCSLDKTTGSPSALIPLAADSLLISGRNIWCSKIKQDSIFSFKVYSFFLLALSLTMVDTPFIYILSYLVLWVAFCELMCKWCWDLQRLKKNQYTK